MEKTIKEEMARTILSSELLNENSLLVVSKKETDEYPVLSVRYIDKGAIQEARITELRENVEVEHNDKMVAVFKTITCLGIPRPILSDVYDLDYHQFAGSDFNDLLYKLKVKEGTEVKQLVKSSK